MLFTSQSSAPSLRASTLKQRQPLQRQLLQLQPLQQSLALLHRRLELRDPHGALLVVSWRQLVRYCLGSFRMYWFEYMKLFSQDQEVGPYVWLW
jgi:hypothetical protein